MNQAKDILVLCTGNSCRSQIAEGYLVYFLNGKAHVYSAGVETHGVNPRAIETMKEDGIDISHHTSKHVDSLSHITFDFVITVCDHAQERCPIFISSAKTIHHNFKDPAKAKGTEAEIMTSFREVRTEIKVFCEAFVRNNDWSEA